MNHGKLVPLSAQEFAPAPGSCLQPVVQVADCIRWAIDPRWLRCSSFQNVPRYCVGRRALPSGRLAHRRCDATLSPRAAVARKQALLVTPGAKGVCLRQIKANNRNLRLLLGRRRNAQNATVAAIGNQVNESIGSLLHVANALSKIAQIALFSRDGVVLQDQPD